MSLRIIAFSFFVCGGSIAAVYPLRSTEQQMLQAERDGNKLIDSYVSKDSRHLLEYYANVEKKKESSFSLFKGPQFIEPRRHIHQQILDQLFSNYPATVDAADPDIFVLAGMAGSGKTSTLNPLIAKPSLPINPDYFKDRLSKWDVSPLTQWPLVHASYLHEESTYLAELAFDRAIKGKYNIALEKTLSSFSSVEVLLRKAKDAGYDIHLLATQVYPHIAVEIVARRFLTDEEGRYVPLDVLKKNGNEIQENVLKYRESFDSYTIFDTSDFNKVSIIFRGGDVEKNYRSPM